MMNNKKIKIKGKKHLLKAQSYRAMFLFEEITEKPINELKSLQDQVTYIYCVLISSNENFNYTLEEFFDILEEDNTVIEEFAKLNIQKKK